MIIYGALFIPIITCVVLYVYFRHKTLLWEFLIPIIVSFILIISSKAIIEYVQVTSEEYWGSLATKVEYFEPWNEYVHQICYRTVSCGENCTRTESYDCSYVRYHSASWMITTSTNETVSISKSQYNELKKKFGNEQFVDLRRKYHTKDGDKYVSQWMGDSLTAEPVTTVHSYENRVKASDHSVFNYGEVSDDDKKRFGLFDYPNLSDKYKMKSVLGDDSSDGEESEKKINFLNAKLGKKKEVHVFILVFKDQPIEAGIYQEWLWCGGNKNEFIVAVSIDSSRQVKWCRPISWTRNEQLKSTVKAFVEEQDTLCLSSTADFLYKEIDEGFERRHFEEFSYLTVEPSTTAIVIVYILTLLVNISLSYWIIINEYEE